MGIGAHLVARMIVEHDSASTDFRKFSIHLNSPVNAGKRENGVTVTIRRCMTTDALGRSNPDRVPDRKLDNLTEVADKGASLKRFQESHSSSRGGMLCIAPVRPYSLSTLR